MVKPKLVDEREEGESSLWVGVRVSSAFSLDDVLDILLEHAFYS